MADDCGTVPLMPENAKGLTLITSTAGTITPEQRRNIVRGQIRSRPAQMVEGAYVPYGYEIWKDGVYREENVLEIDDNAQIQVPIPSLCVPCPVGWKAALKRICAAPTMLISVATSIETDEKLVALWTIDQGEHVLHWDLGNVISKRSKLSDLPNRGFSINENTAAEMMNFFDAVKNDPRNKAMLNRLVARRLGWHDVPKYRIKGWLMGETWIGTTARVYPDRRVIPNPKNDRPVYGERGSFQEWLKVARYLVNKYPHLRTTFGVAFASLLVRPTNCRSFTVHHVAGSGHSKTAGAQFALSAFGDPSAMKETLLATNNAIIAVFQKIDDFGMLLDESEAMDGKLSLKEVIYQFAGEKTKMRAIQDGSLGNRGTGWKGILRTTGERAILGNDKRDLGGQLGRMITFEAPVGISKEDTDLIYEFIGDGKHYGHAGPLFMQRLFETMTDPVKFQWLRDQFKEVRENFLEYLQKVLPRVDVKRLNNNALQYALLSIGTGLMLHWVFGEKLDWSMNAGFEGVCADMTTKISPEDYQEVSHKAVDALRQLVEGSGRFVDISQGNARIQMERLRGGPPMLGVTHGNAPDAEIWFFPDAIDAELRALDFPPSRVWSDLQRSKILSCQAGRTRVKRKNAQVGLKGRYYVIKRGNFETEIEEPTVATPTFTAPAVPYKHEPVAPEVSLAQLAFEENIGDEDDEWELPYEGNNIDW
jgi:hypothetical protein